MIIIVATLPPRRLSMSPVTPVPTHRRRHGSWSCFAVEFSMQLASFRNPPCLCSPARSAHKAEISHRVPYLTGWLESNAGDIQEKSKFPWLLPLLVRSPSLPFPSTRFQRSSSLPIVALVSPPWRLSPIPSQTSLVFSPAGHFQRDEGSYTSQSCHSISCRRYLLNGCAEPVSSFMRKDHQNCSMPPRHPIFLAAIVASFTTFYLRLFSPCMSPRKRKLKSHKSLIFATSQ